ncbi:MAG: hypothetical protein DMG36_16855 [Acidobacteria bacterium]|nr:MAG: hypothetical protein DMG36_16855 [Acidobacteriota bacterium]
MESSAILPRGALLPVLVCLGMTFATEVAVAQCPDRGTVVDDEVSNTQGKPYQAKEVRTVVTYGSDGTKREVVTKSNLFRDGRGRIRVERFYDGTEDPSENVPADIWIDDNCGTSVSLLPARQTAKITKVASPVKVSHQPCCQEVDLKNPPHTGPEGKVEDLGHKFIDGVEVRGERISYYSSAQAKLSGASPVRIYENWCSISLDTRMGDYILDDKPKREITTVISDIKQIEPASSLFEIPEGYKIIRADQSAPASNAEGSQSATSMRQ